MAKKLNIPYRSQLDTGAEKYLRDCGAACGAMLLKAYTDTDISVNSFYEKAGIIGKPSGRIKDENLWASQIMAVLINHGVYVKWRRLLSLIDLQFHIERKRPMITLYNYEIIRQRGIKTQIDFDGSHYAVVVGFDEENIYLNDPLWTSNKGEELPIPITIWMEAWDRFQLDKNGNPINPSRCAIIAEYPIGEKVPYEDFDTKIQKTMRIIYPKGMNVRSGPGINHPKIGSYNYGEIVNIYKEEKAGNNIWGQLGRNKWIAIQFNGNQYLVPEFPGGTTDPSDFILMRVVAKDGVNVRSGPGINNCVVRVLMYGTPVHVYEEKQVNGNKWGRIGVDQWIATKYKGEILAEKKV